MDLLVVVTIIYGATVCIGGPILLYRRYKESEKIHRELDIALEERNRKKINRESLYRDNPL